MFLLYTLGVLKSTLAVLFLVTYKKKKKKHFFLCGSYTNPKKYLFSTLQDSQTLAKVLDSVSTCMIKESATSIV